MHLHGHAVFQVEQIGGDHHLVGLKAFGDRVELVLQFAHRDRRLQGELENQLYPITKGLEGNQMVVTTNLLNLKHGMPVQVQPAKAN